MDSLLNAAARRLLLGDPLGALDRVALRDDAPALALRGVAMAQLGDLTRADALLKRAVRGFEPSESLARARTIAARAEVRFAARDLAPLRGLDAALSVLDRHGDRVNALHMRLLAIRRELLVGNLDEADRALAKLDLGSVPPMLATLGELAKADVALRRIQAKPARSHLSRALENARRSHIPALVSEVEHALTMLDAPAARAVSEGRERTLTLADVERSLKSQALIVDSCQRVVRAPGCVVALRTRPVLFALLRTLAAAWPAPAERTDLLREAFGARRSDASHRARLRVEIGRLRRALADVATLRAAPGGFLLVPRRARRVVTLLPPVSSDAAALLALMNDGQAWATSALALALGTSQRSVQRALLALQNEGKVEQVGRGRALRWLAPPVSAFTTTLLLLAQVAGD